jgi:hypothetical protein
MTIEGKVEGHKSTKNLCKHHLTGKQVRKNVLNILDVTNGTFKEATSEVKETGITEHSNRKQERGTLTPEVKKPSDTTFMPFQSIPVTTQGTIIHIRIFHNNRALRNT